MAGFLFVARAMRLSCDGDARPRNMPPRAAPSSWPLAALSDARQPWRASR